MDTPFLHVTLPGGQKLIGLDAVREILPMMQLHESPTHPGEDGFRGFANLRGTLVPVYQSKESVAMSPDAFIIVFKEGDKLWGRVVDDVQDIVHVSAEQLCEAGRADGHDARAARLGDDVVGILNPSIGSRG